MTDHWPDLDDTFGTGAPLRHVLDSQPRHDRTSLDAWRRDRAGAVATHRERGAAAVVTDHLVVTRTWPRWLVRHHASAGEAWDAWLHEGLPHGRAPLGGRRHPHRDGMAHATSLLSHLPPSWVPSDHEGWLAFLRCWTVVEDAWALVGPARLAAFLDVGGRWAEWSARLCRTTGTDPKGLVRALRDVGDVDRALLRQVVVPAFALRDDGPAAPEPGVSTILEVCRAFRGARTLNGVLEASARWHARQGAMLDALAALPGTVPRSSDRWPPGLPDHVHGDVTLKVLATSAELLAEGGSRPDRDGVLGLDHCVGGHADSCRAGRSRIVSLRRVASDGTFERMSTASLSIGREVTVSEHRGHRNGWPSEECAVALAAYVAHLGSRVVIDRSDFVPIVPVDHDGVAVDAGYDFRHPGNHAAVVALWDPLLPRPLRGLDAQGWVDAFGAAPDA